MRIWTIVTMLATLSLQCCGNNNVPDNIDSKAPDKGPPNEYKFTQEFPYSMEFEQGRSATYNVIQTVKVPFPGNPILTFQSLPAGAVFDGTNITWTPPCNLTADFFNNRNYKILPLMAKLSSSLDSSQFVDHSVFLIVHRFVEFDDRKCGK